MNGRPSAPGKRPALRGWIAGALLLRLAGALVAAPDGVLPGQAEDERRVKALFLFNFAKFVEWPSPLPPGPIRIGVVGDENFADILEKIVSGKIVEGHAFAVERSAGDAPPQNCQIVFIPGSERKRMRPILDALQASPVLTVGETRGFAEAGGVINFEIVDNKVRFEINLEAASRARLKLSSKLLSLAKIVHERGG
jgi:hypothetical protein